MPVDSNPITTVEAKYSTCLLRCSRRRESDWSLRICEIKSKLLLDLRRCSPDSASSVYTGMTMRVSKWGNDLAIRLPAAIVEALDLREGDGVILRAAGRRRLEIEKAPSAKEMLARLRRFRGRLPKDLKFDRVKSNYRGA